MKFAELWNRIGKQPLQMMKKSEAIVFIGNEQYRITNCRYKNGMLVGFDAEELRQRWFSASVKPEEDTWVVVRDKNGKEYDYHQWNGMCWYAFVVNDDETCDGWRSDVGNIAEWRYQFDNRKNNMAMEKEEMR